MKKSKVVFVVGHSSWGKSSTLNSLKGYWQKRRVLIGGTEFLIKAMSNDDDPKGLLDFIDDLNIDLHPNIIMALCPSFKDDKAKTQKIIDLLIQKGYKPFFWAIKHQWGTGNVLSPEEISELRKSGAVEVYSENKDQEHRGKALKKFIEGLIA